MTKEQARNEILGIVAERFPRFEVSTFNGHLLNVSVGNITQTKRELDSLAEETKALFDIASHARAGLTFGFDPIQRAVAIEMEAKAKESA